MPTLGRVSPGRDHEPEYAWLRELVATRGEDLRRRYGAHAVGIGRRRVGDRKKGRLALRVYLDPEESQRSPGAEPVPETIAFTPAGSDDAVHLPTDVILSSPARLE